MENNLKRKSKENTYKHLTDLLKKQPNKLKDLLDEAKAEIEKMKVKKQVA